MSANLAAFMLTDNRQLYRLFLRVLPDGTPGAPAWFCDGSTPCRFDLPAPAGTCYVADTAFGAFVERFLRIGRDCGIAMDEVGKRRLATVGVSEAVRLIDLNQPQNLFKHGITPQLVHEMGPPYPLSTAFAVSAHSEDFDGVRYLSQRDITSSEVCMAVFAPTSGADTGKIFDVHHEGPIRRELVEVVAATFEVPILWSASSHSPN
ncbi:RES domain-containing protein [Streptomyces sp. NPDC059037]|uniref:RES domain-containing protein n=1 Tax=Streptomyces sp. NPDC059037 TaxID=3346710 RepID=UPI0036B05299